MTGVPAGLEAELRHLRKGEGIVAERLADRVGPRLRLVAGVPDGADTGEIRQRVMAWLVTATATLGEQERLAAAAAFAVPPAGRQRFLSDRLGWLAARLHCDERT